MQPPLNEFPGLDIGVLRLRPLQSTEAAAFRDMTDNPAITDVVHFLPTPFRLSDALALIRSMDEDNCFIGIWTEDALVGVIGIHSHAGGGIEIGYWIGTSWQGRHFATTAVTGIIGQLRTIYPVNRIVAECRPENEASWHLLKNLGFQPAGAAGMRPGREILQLALG